MEPPLDLFEALRWMPVVATHSLPLLLPSGVGVEPPAPAAAAAAAAQAAAPTTLPPRVGLAATIRQSVLPWRGMPCDARQVYVN